MNPAILFVLAPVVLLGGILLLAGIGNWAAFWAFAAAAVVMTLTAWVAGREWTDR